MNQFKLNYLVLFLFLFALKISGQEYLSEGSPLKYDIEKCSRLQAGTVFSQYTFLNEKNDAFGFHLQHNYCIKTSEHNGFGIGAGISVFTENTFLPLTLEHLHCTPKNFFYSVQAGYAFAWKRQSEYFNEYSLNGGVNGGLGLGYRLKKGEIFNYCMQLSYYYQQTRLSKTGFNNEYTGFHSVVLTLGILLEKK